MGRYITNGIYITKKVEIQGVVFENYSDLEIILDDGVEASGCLCITDKDEVLLLEEFTLGVYDLRETKFKLKGV